MHLRSSILCKLISCSIGLSFISILHAGDRSEVTPVASVSNDPFVKLEDQIKALGDKGVLLQFTDTNEEFANLSGGLGRGAEYEGLLKLAATLDLKKLTDWNGATFYASLLYAYGNGITNRYVGDYNVLT